MTPLPDSNLPLSTPDAQGLPSSAVLAFVDAADRQLDAVHSLVLVRHGHVVARGGWAPHRPDQPHMLFSLSKSFTSTAIGLAVADGLLRVDDPVLPFFPEISREMNGRPEQGREHLAALQVRHLLTMTTGHDTDTTQAMVAPDGDWARAVLTQPIVHPPGTHFVYNSGASYLLSAIVQRLTGSTLLEYLRPRLLEPLGIVDATWQSCPRGVNAGGWGLSLSTDEVARFGQLYLQRGVWLGEQLVPSAWVDEATAWQTANDAGPSDDSGVDWRQGYGYQFWRSRHGAYRGDGAFGQFCLVMPEQGAVLAVTAGLSDMQMVLDLAWEHLLPALEAAPQPADTASHGRLEQRLATLALPPATGRASTATSARVSGRTYRVATGESAPEPAAAPLNGPTPRRIETFSFGFEADGWHLTVRDDQGIHDVAGGYCQWRLGRTTLVQAEPDPIAASGAWTDDDTFVAQLSFFQTPFRYTLSCRFDGDEANLTVGYNVSFDAVVPMTITAQMELVR